MAAMRVAEWREAFWEARKSPLIFFGVALVNLGVIGWQLLTFGRLMHRITVQGVPLH